MNEDLGILLREKVKKMTAGEFVSYILGIFFLIIALGMLVRSSYFPFILALVGFILLFPPLQKIIFKKFNFELSLGLKVLLTIVIIILSVWYSFNLQSNKVPERIYNLGDKVVVGDLEFVIHNVTVSNFSLVTFEPFPDGVFITLDFTVKNIGNEPLYPVGDTIRLMDSGGRVYDGKRNTVQYENLQPLMPKKGKVVFDVPENFNGVIELLDGLLFTLQKKYVSLPLTQKVTPIIESNKTITIEQNLTPKEFLESVTNISILAITEDWTGDRNEFGIGGEDGVGIYINLEDKKGQTVNKYIKNITFKVDVEIWETDVVCSPNLTLTTPCKWVKLKKVYNGEHKVDNWNNKGGTFSGRGVIQIPFKDITATNFNNGLVAIKVYIPNRMVLEGENVFAMKVII